MSGESQNSARHLCTNVGKGAKSAPEAANVEINMNYFWSTLACSNLGIRYIHVGLYYSPKFGTPATSRTLWVLLFLAKKYPFWGKNWF